MSIVANDVTIQNIIAAVPGFKLYKNQYRGPCGTFPDLQFTFGGSAKVYTVSRNRFEVASPASDCIVLLQGVSGSALSSFILLTM